MLLCDAMVLPLKFGCTNTTSDIKVGFIDEDAACGSAIEYVIVLGLSLIIQQPDIVIV